MPNYSIGLSGLQQSSNSMDVISNNIANASTVGYRAGEFIFEDQFYKAMNPMDPARAGMGSAKQNIRRLWNMGAIQQSANTLDMAITGSMGLFRLTSNADDPAQTYYTRNGQFAISKEVDPSYPKRSYIVNENGMFLTGYISTDGKQLSNTHTNRLSMPPTSIDPITTENSTMSVTLDARQTAFIPEANIEFDPEVPTSYTNKVSQTVYHLGDAGNPHTLELYYRRVEDKNMTVLYDGSYLKYEPNSVADPKASTEPQGAMIENNKSYVVLTSESSGPNFDYLSSADRKTNATVELKGKDYINVDVNSDISDMARVIINGKDSGVVKKATDSLSQISTAVTTAAVAGSSAETSTVTLTNASLFKAGDLVNVQIQGKVYEYTVSAAQGAETVAATQLASITSSVASMLDADKSILGLTSANAAAGVITVVGATQGDGLDISVWAQRPAQSSGAISTAKTATADAVTAEISKVTLTGGFTEGDRVSVALQGQTFTYTVTAADAVTGVSAVVNGVHALIDAQKTALGVTLVKASPDITITAGNKNDPLDVEVSVNKAIQLSGDITVGEDDDVMFFNPVTTAYPGSAVSTANKVITVATSDSAIEVGQYLWKKSKAGIFTQLNAKVVEISGKQLTLDNAVTLSKDDQIVFYQPVTYTVMLQDGAKVQMTAEHKRNATADVPQTFTAVTSQVEVYGGLDGTMFNGADSRFSSDSDVKATVDGSYDPLAVIQFWGGQNIDAIRFDATTGKPSFETKVQLKGIVTSSGKTNGPGSLPISEDHPLEFNLDLTGTRHFATSFSVDANYQDGYPTSMLSNVTIDPEGKIVGTYSDGREFIAGQLALVNFAAVNGLVPSGNNVFQASYMSGNEINENVIIGKPGERGLGGIRAGSYEGSNVDLSNELVKLLIQQRMYSANSQSIRAFDDTLTTTIRMTGG